MTDDIIGEKMEIEPGAQLTFATSPKDAPTFSVNGIRGVMVLAHTTTFAFFEQAMEIDGSVAGRHVVNITAPNDQFCEIADLLARIAHDIRTQGGPGSIPSLKKS